MTVDAELEDLDRSAAEFNNLEGLNNEAATPAASHTAAVATPMPPSLRKSIYGALKPEIAKLAEEAAGRIHSQRESVSRNMVEIGKELRSIKDTLDHGMFGKWIQAEFEMTAKTAQTYMNVARMVEESGSVLNLNLSDTALQLLAAPNADSVRDELTKTIAIDIKAGKPTPKPKRVKEMIATATGKLKAPAKAAATSMTTTSSTPAEAGPVLITKPPTPAKAAPTATEAPSTAKAPTISATATPTTVAAEQAWAAARVRTH